LRTLEGHNGTRLPAKFIDDKIDYLEAVFDPGFDSSLSEDYVAKRVFAVNGQ
jgi:hypothetical protein